MTKPPARGAKRRHDRLEADLPVTVRTADSTVTAALEFDAANLSEGGAFLRSELLFEEGEELALEIALPSGQIIGAAGRVVRVARAAYSPPGMGIEFTNLSTNDRKSIVEALKEKRNG